MAHRLDRRLRLTISQTDRARLEERRRLRQLRRSRQDQSRTFRQVAHALCEQGVRGFSKLLPKDCLEIALRFAHLPGQDERFVWPQRDCRRWDSPTGRDELFRQALLACTSLQGSVCVIFHPYQAGLRIPAATLHDHAATVIADQFEAIWVTRCDPAWWLIEIAAIDNELCFSLDLSPQVSP